MTVELHYQPYGELFPRGFSATYNTADEALTQAVADVQSGRVPGPDQIVDGDGGVAYDRPAIEKAAKKAS